MMITMLITGVMMMIIITTTSDHGNGGKQATSPRAAPLWVTLHISTARRVSVGPPQNCLISWRIWFVLLSRTDPRPMDASPPRLDHSIVFARWCQFARGSTRVVLPRRDLDPFIRFAGRMVVTNRRTDHATASVVIGRFLVPVAPCGLGGGVE